MYTHEDYKIGSMKNNEKVMGQAFKIGVQSLAVGFLNVRVDHSANTNVGPPGFEPGTNR